MHLPCSSSVFVVVCRTPFGREYEIVAYTDLDSHRAEKDVNHWIIQTGHPPEPTGPASMLPLGTQQ